MPILSPGDPEFEGFDVTQQFSSDLPGEKIISGGVVSSFYAGLVAETAVFQQWKNFSRMARIGTANMAITAGLPRDRLGALASLYAEAPRITQSSIGKVVEALLRDEHAVLEGALLGFDDALEIIGTKVPVVGWVVKIGLGVWKVVKAVIAATKSDSDKVARSKAIAYAKAPDEELVRMMLDEMKNEDWTRFFLPQQKPDDVCTSALAYTARGQADGIAWEVCEPGADPWGWGLTPGLSSRFTGIVGVWQSPHKLRGSNRNAGVESITPFGELHPSAVQLGLALWQMCLKNSATAFRIDGSAIVSAWIDQSELLTDFAYNHADDWLRGQILNGIEWFTPETDHSRVDGYHPDDLPTKYTQSNLWWYSELVSYVVNEIWKPRLEGYLETITVAYVPPDAPALRDDKLATKHHEMRQLLLEHDARRDVEVALIPDSEYRSLMHNAKMKISGSLAIAPTRRISSALDYVPPVDPSKPLPPAPDSDPAPGVTPIDGEGGAGALVALLGILGVVAVAKRARGR